MIRDRLVIFERLTEGTQNAFNEPAETWAELCREWARQEDVSDGEKVTAGMQYSAQVSRFTVRSNDATRTITSKDRMITPDSATWDVIGAKEADRSGWRSRRPGDRYVTRNKDIEVTAQRRSD